MYEGMAADEQPDKINEGKAPMQVRHGTAQYGTVGPGRVSECVRGDEIFCWIVFVALVLGGGFRTSPSEEG